MTRDVVLHRIVATRTPALTAIIGVLVAAGVASFQVSPEPTIPGVPVTWDDREMGQFEVPLARAEYSPKHVPSDYYYRLPVRPVYTSYPIYHPDREPAGYLQELRTKEPEIAFDEAKVNRTEEEWIAAGSLVFDAPLDYDPPFISFDDVRDPSWYKNNQVLLTRDGMMPFARYVVRKKGAVEVGNLACGFCHTRVMPDGALVRGAQGNPPNIPIRDDDCAPRRRQLLMRIFETPWDRREAERTFQLPCEGFKALSEGIPPGVFMRQGTSPRAPAKLPDLIGIQERRYLDATGFVRHRSIGDLMRYAAVNQTMDMLASYGGWIPAPLDHKTLPPVGQSRFEGTYDRYSDAQLYALAKFLYSLTPPRNPNTFDATAAAGQRVFERERCATCHTPPLYTNNRLTLARGFTPPQEHFSTYDIQRISVGTDPTLAMETRRGTGYYKVPSLKGLWYRGPIEHSGSVATLEDWFDPARLRDNYVPTGFRGPGVKTRAVTGHEFGLTLSAQDKAALIAFLRTL